MSPATRRPLVAVVLAVALVVPVVLGAPDHAGASLGVPVPTPARQRDPAGGASAPDPAPGQGLSAAVSAVPATSHELDAAEADGDRLRSRRGEADDELSGTVGELSRVDQDRAALAQLVVRRDEQITKATAAHDRSRADLRAVAIEWFVTGFGVTAALDPTLDADQREALERGRVLSESAAESSLADERYAAARRRALVRERDEMAARRDELDQRSGELASRRDELTATIVGLDEQLVRNEQRVAEARMTATVEGTDLSTGALDAYWRASVRLAADDPSCGVPWWALAGIGRTESRHGTYRGAALGRDGTVSPPIYGPDLDGSNTFRVVPDTDGGALDGTSTTDRAVGPMQFLPGTWRAMGRDGTGDGVADPQNLYDAAVAAGVYLCRSGPGLDRDEGRLRAGYLTYNRSLEYVEIVLGHARGYRDAVPLS